MHWRSWHYGKRRRRFGILGQSLANLGEDWLFPSVSFRFFFWKELANRRILHELKKLTGHSHFNWDDFNSILVILQPQTETSLPLPQLLGLAFSIFYRVLPCWPGRNCAAAEEARAVSLQRHGQWATAPLQIQAWGETCAPWDSTKAGWHGWGSLPSWPTPASFC